MSHIFEVHAEADFEVKLYFNGEPVAFEETLTMIRNGRTFVPIRFFSQLLGVEIEWKGAEEKVLLYIEDSFMVLRIDSTLYEVNAQYKVMDEAPYIHQGRTWVPLRLLSELGVEVNWSAIEKEIYMYQAKDRIINVQWLAGQNRLEHVTDEELEWLARIIYAESQGEPLKGQIAVGAVVVNRIHYHGFPHSIYDVIFQQIGSSFQFTPARTGRIFDIEPDESAYKAAKKAIAGYDPTDGALFFYNPSISNSTFMRTRDVATRIGNHLFLY
jgi:hypothetical protein